LWSAFIYNGLQQDENGGLLDLSKLNDIRYADKKTFPIVFQHDDYSTTRSAVTNVQKETIFQKGVKKVSRRTLDTAFRGC
jgi:hypothetical protein